jgi:hypothetical protein
MIFRFVDEFERFEFLIYFSIVQAYKDAGKINIFTNKIHYPGNVLLLSI